MIPFPPKRPSSRILAGIALLGLAIAMLWLPGWLSAADTAAPLAMPTGRTKNCTDGGCHAKQRDYKVLHGPTGIGACDVCHLYKDEAKHTFKLRDTGKALCDFCHVGKIEGKVVHKPVMDGQCLSCHNPHGGADRSVLRKPTVAALCADCHKDITKGRSHVHGPVATGSCAACHDAHRADYPKLLAAQGRDLCISCHDQMGKELKQVKFIHKPVTGDCQQCHEVHASNQIMQLKQSPFDLCASCHEKIKTTAQTAPHKHSAVTEGSACLTCHTPHGSAMAKLMKDLPAKACMSCHDKPIQAGPDHVVATMSAVAQKGLFKHGPINDGNCSGCHEVHGSNQSRLLAKPYPETFYQPFSVESYDLCFTCHQKQLVLLPKTVGLTNFRNGDQNLHYVHVNKAERGRSCRACHETHASEQPFHIRQSVPFGKWELPIQFKATANGGGCTPGCHKELRYDRVNPVQQQGPGAMPASPSAGGAMQGATK